MRRLALLGTLGLAASLAGCGGGGGGSVASTPTPTPNPVITTPPVTATPTPTPTPTPTTTNFNDSEYARSNANVAAFAINAYNAGATGSGSKIAIIDSGLTDPGTEFSGRIDPASTDFGGNGSFADSDGHGTSVAGVAAAARNGSQTEGMAFTATVLALRADTSGSCATSDGCKFNSTNIANAIDYATAHGATVINLSLGSDDQAPDTVRQAIARATSAGIVVVMAAGNSAGDNPEAFASLAADASVAHGLVIIAGAHDAGYAIASFSNKAGIDASVYLTALGDRVRGFDNTGQAYLLSGTSFSTPAIAGAVALIRSAFPTMSGAQIVDLLYRTATDAGAAGIDPVFGRGILNLTRAFQPVGTTSLAGSAIAIGNDATATLGSAMGDASARSLGRAVVLDSYGRAFDMALGGGVDRAAERRPLGNAIGRDIRQSTIGNGRMALSVSVERDSFAGQPWAPIAQQGRPAARSLGGSLSVAVDRRTVMSFGLSTAGDGLARQLSPDAIGASFLIAERPGATPGFDTRSGAAFALRHDLGFAAISVAVEQGRLAANRSVDPLPPRYATATTGIDRHFGRLLLSGTAGVLREADSVLGSRFNPAFGGGSRTLTADLGARYDLGGGWQAGGLWRRGWTRVGRSGLLAEAATLGSSAYAIDLTRGDTTSRFGVRLAEPLRVVSGGYWLALPVAYDYATGSTTTEQRRLDLAPAGRERQVEVNWGRGFGFGWLDANLFWRHQPGNVAAAPDDVGAAIRLSARW